MITETNDCSWQQTNVLLLLTHSAYTVQADKITLKQETFSPIQVVFV